MAANRNIGTQLNNFGFIDPSVKAKHAVFLPGDTSGNVIMWAYKLMRLEGPEDTEDDWADDDLILAAA